MRRDFVVIHRYDPKPTAARSEYVTFDWQTDRVDTGVGSEFNPIGVHPQQCDVVVVRSRAVTLVLDHSQHFEVDVFGFLCIATIVFQKSYADIFRFESVFKIVRNVLVDIF